MAEVTIIINRDATDIDTDLTGLQWAKFLFRPGQSVINFQLESRYSNRNKARMLAKETPSEKSCYYAG